MFDRSKKQAGPAILPFVVLLLFMAIIVSVTWLSMPNYSPVMYAKTSIGKATVGQSGLFDAKRKIIPPRIKKQHLPTGVAQQTSIKAPSASLVTTTNSTGDSRLVLHVESTKNAQRHRIEIRTSDQAVLWHHTTAQTTTEELIVEPGTYEIWQENRKTGRIIPPLSEYQFKMLPAQTIHCTIHLQNDTSPRKIDYSACGTMVPDRLMVQLNSPLDLPEKNQFFTDYQLTSVALNQFFLLVDLPEGTPLEDAIAQLENDSRVKLAEPDWIEHSTAPFNQWSLYEANGVEFDRTIYNDCINHDASAEVIVAVIDTGLKYDHPDFDIANVLTDVDKDYYNDDLDAMDDNGHGTEVTGVIAAIHDDTGIDGIAPAVKILPLKTRDASGSGPVSHSITAITYAVSQGAQVINISAGSYNSYSQTYQDAINSAASLGAIIIASSGNSGISDPHYPSGYDNVYSVAATQSDGEIWPSSSINDTVDFYQPGSSITTTEFDDAWITVTGTSLSAPNLSAIIAMLKIRNSHESESAFEARLLSLVETVPSQVYGQGIVRLDKLKNHRFISGEILGSSGETASVEVAWTSSGGGSGTLTPDQNGYYSLLAPVGEDCTVSVSQPGFTFTPPEFYFTALAMDQPGQNSTFDAVFYDISGTVETPLSEAVVGVVMSGLPGNPSTNAGGFYTASVPAGWSGTVLPVKSGWTFSPSSNDYTIVMAEATTENFVGTVFTYTISGTILDDQGSPVQGVLLNGLPDSVVTDASGYYEKIVEYGFSATVTPEKIGYDFSPSSKTYSNVATDFPTQDYTTLLQTFTISGVITRADTTPVSGVTMEVNVGDDVITAVDGSWSVQVDYNWSGTVTPQKPGHTFDDGSGNDFYSYTNVLSNISNQNFNATIETFIVSGNILDLVAAPLNGGVVTGFPEGDLTVVSGGTWETTVEYGWYGTISASLTGYTIPVPDIHLYSITADTSSINFTALKLYTLAGKIIRDDNSQPLVAVQMVGFPGTVQTDSQGKYSVVVDETWTGTVTPTLAGYTYTPAETIYAAVNADKLTEDYQAEIFRYTISGFVRDGSGVGTSGVLLTGFPDTVETAVSGQFITMVDHGFSATIIPVKAGYNFTAASRTLTNVTGDTAGQDFTLSIKEYTVSGYVKTSTGTPIIGVTLMGLPGSPVNNTVGFFTSTVEHGYTTSVVPVKAGYRFTPGTIEINALSDNQSLSFTGGLYQRISGVIETADGTPIEGVQLNGFPDTVITAVDGTYYAMVDQGWSDTVVPYKIGHTFTPDSKVYTTVLTDFSPENYTAAIAAFSIKGQVLDAQGAPVSGAVFADLPGNPSTIADGTYTAWVDYGFSGTATPQLSGYDFTPAVRTIPAMTTNLTSQDFAGQIKSYAVSGTITYADLSPAAGVAIIGLPVGLTTDASGFYSGTVEHGFTGTIYPSLLNHTFSPSEIPLEVIGGNTDSQDFIAALNTWYVSGTILSDTGNPVSGVELSGFPSLVTTGADGIYNAAVNHGWSGTVSAVLTGYDFTPLEIVHTNITAASVGHNYTGTLKAWTLSGSVKKADSTPVIGVVLTGLPGSPVTDVNGEYSVGVAHGFSGTVAAELAGYTFSPSTILYPGVNGDTTGENYVATLNTYTLAGAILMSDGSPLPGVTMNGLVGTPVTDVSGRYSITVDHGYSAVVTPTLAGHAFTPATRVYTGITGENYLEDYSAVVTWTISGTVKKTDETPLVGILMTGLPDTPVTDASGNYSVAVPEGWTGSALPTIADYTFSPEKIDYTNITANQSSQDFYGTLNTYYIAGKIARADGTPVSGVLLSGLPGNPLTDVNGLYRVIVDYGWSGTVTPTVNGYSISPASQNYSSVTAHHDTDNYLGTVFTYNVSGYLKTETGNALSGVTITGLPDAPVTNSLGYYESSVEYGFSGTLIPELSGCRFTPAELVLNNVQSSRLDLFFRIARHWLSVTMTPAEGRWRLATESTSEVHTSGAAVLLSEGDTWEVLFSDINGFITPTSLNGTMATTDIAQSVTYQADTWIVGTITDENGVGLDASVEILLSGSLVAETSSDSSGAYSFNQLAPGEYWIRAYRRDGDTAGFYPSLVVKNVVVGSSATVNLSLRAIESFVATTTSAAVSGNALRYNPTFDNQISVSRGDVVTAHNDDGILCGVFIVENSGLFGDTFTMKVYGDDLVTPVEEGMNAAESIQFRINQRQASITSGSSIWNDGATVALDIQMEATTVQNIDLQVGWNLVSFRLDPSNEDPKLFFASINGSYTSIRTYEWRENQMKPTVCFPEPYSIYNTMDKVDVRLGYQIKVTQAVTLQITGTPVPVGMKYPLRNGWNMIAYPGLVPLAVSTGLAPIDLPARFTTVRTWVYESGSMRPRFHYPAPFDVYSTFSELQPEQGILIRMLYSSPPDPEVFEIVYPESVMSLPE